VTRGVEFPGADSSRHRASGKGKAYVRERPKLHVLPPPSPPEQGPKRGRAGGRAHFEQPDVINCDREVPSTDISSLPTPLTTRPYTVHGFPSPQLMIFVRSCLTNTRLPSSLASRAIKHQRHYSRPNFPSRTLATMATDPTKYKLNHSMCAASPPRS
jgi:hypothetical protein